MSFSSRVKALAELLALEGAIEELAPLAAECGRLSSLKDCPVPSTLLVAQLVLAEAFGRLEAKGHLSEQENLNLGSLRQYVADTLAKAIEKGAEQSWDGLSDHFRRLFSSPDKAVH